jgi:hypothetical protein
MTTQQQSSEQPSRETAVGHEPALRREAEHLLHEAREIWGKVKVEVRKPAVGAAVAGAAVLAAGVAWGAGEAAVAAFAAYMVFRMLRRRASQNGAETPPEQARSTHSAATPGS